MNDQVIKREKWKRHAMVVNIAVLGCFDPIFQHYLAVLVGWAVVLEECCPSPPELLCALPCPDMLLAEIMAIVSILSRVAPTPVSMC